MKRGLTIRQAEVLSFLRDRIAAIGYPPTMREIGCHFGWFGSHAAADHVEVLEHKGCVARVPRAARGLRITHAAGPPSRVDLASGAAVVDSTGRSGVAYRVTCGVMS